MYFNGGLRKRSSSGVKDVVDREAALEHLVQLGGTWSLSCFLFKSLTGSSAVLAGMTVQGDCANSTANKSSRKGGHRAFVRFQAILLNL